MKLDGKCFKMTQMNKIKNKKLINNSLILIITLNKTKKIKKLYLEKL
jgi:hypothetical protein